MDREFINLPTEFMLDSSLYPVATRVPLYKTLTTRGITYPAKEIDLTQEVNILLISSNTYVTPNNKILIGDEESRVDFTLPSRGELDVSHDNELESIGKIANEARNKGGWKLNIDLFHTDELDYTTFLDLISSDRYHIVHYQL
jgi:hypothetical protein